MRSAATLFLVFVFAILLAQAFHTATVVTIVDAKGLEFDTVHIRSIHPINVQ
jgi:hypothetical protein